MGARKKILSGGVVFALCIQLAPTTTFNAAPPPFLNEFFVGATWEQTPPVGSPLIEQSWSSLAKSPSLGIASSVGDTVCSSMSDPKCITYGREVTSNKISSWASVGSFGYAWIAVFPQCKTTEELNCVANLTATLNNETLNTEFSRNFPRGTPFTGDPALKIPNGGYAPVYKVDGLPKTSDPSQTESKEFVVRVTAYGQNRIASCSSEIDARSLWCKNRGKNVKTDGFDWPEWRLEGFRVDVMRPRLGFDLGPGRTNAPIEYVEIDVDKDVRFNVTARIADYVMPRGWMHGRLNNPTFTQTPINGGFELGIGGDATQVPNPTGNLTCSDYPRLTTAETAIARENFEQQWKSRLQDAGIPPAPVCEPTAAQRLVQAAQGGRVYHAGQYKHNSLARRADLTARKDEFIQNQVSWLVALGDKAYTTSSEWMLEWLPPDDPSEPWAASPCIGNGLAGIVSTNASMYAELPIFDPQTGSLEYAMAGPHYLEDGATLNQGTYSLIVSRDYVLCEWGLDPANTTMTVSVRYDSGRQQAPPSTTTSYDGQFFSLTAAGFTFSAPKVRVKPKERKIRTTKTVRAKSRSKVNISTVIPPKKRHTTSWYVQSGKCKINKAAPRILTMPKNGSCKVAVTQFNLRTKKSSRTLITLRT